MTQHDTVLAKLRDYYLGPMRFMNMLSCFELGLIDALKNGPSAGKTSGQLAAETGISVNSVQQMLLLLVKDDLVSFDEKSDQYALHGLAALTDQDLVRVMPWMETVKHVCLRQLYYLSESIRTERVVGLKEFYDFDGNFYEASTRYPELQESWGALMDQITASADPWFYSNLEVPHGSKILDVAGNTGLGAILAFQHNRDKGVHVTCFDLPEKKRMAEKNFRESGLVDHCSFIAGDALQEIPKGFDVIMIKHFLPMFDMDNVLKIMNFVHDALEFGGKFYILEPIYPEDLKQSSSVDFFPAYFLGCTMAQGGMQRISTYRHWLESCGFEVTKVITRDPSDMSPDSVLTHGILCATKKTPGRGTAGVRS
ncbi:methyltransferase [Streptomyces sp. NPDC005876]|uniref:methyltransferase n=1 Tax=Streptomyces sp. NPDC005876 TaxID=3157076 RepID=UPI0033DB7EC8